MTPEEARALLDGTTPAYEWWADIGGFDRIRRAGPIEWGATGDGLECTEADAWLIAAAPALAAMVAGMRTEWGVHVTGYPKNIADWREICDDPAESTDWFADEEAAEDFATEREDDGYDTRIIRRYVTTEEEIE